MSGVKGTGNQDQSLLNNNAFYNPPSKELKNNMANCRMTKRISMQRV